ncbi:hypothetical protein IQ07DRAFT_591788 [Pyrenochaeta sp. DS3sAY3a]|nr:hypothetical protein IQ07DRAFT_591788 [Pyrenochaeta sp. DS3sAY3a]
MGEPLVVGASIAKEASPSTSSLENHPIDEYDNFYSPENKEFYSTIQYMSLKPEDRKIRLLRIHPLKDDQTVQSPIQADLVDNQSLAAMKGKFTTLSYCAGDPRNTETILVNGLNFNAFANLGHALRMARNFWKLRHGDVELLLWVDQVCINQSDVNERSHQVTLMGSIYKSALQVLACLSVDGTRSGGIRWLQRNFSNIVRVRGNDKEGLDQASKLLLEGYRDANFHNGWGVFLATVVQSPWWPRAWIRQEFIKSQKAYFLAGDEGIHYKALEGYLDVYDQALRQSHWVFQHPCPFSSPTSSDTCLVCCRHSNPAIDRKLSDRLDCALKLFSSKRVLSFTTAPEEYRDLMACVRYMYLCEASDPRDLVYACLGLSSHNYNIRPNYVSHFSFHDLLTHLAQSVIKQDRSLNATLLHARGTASDRAPGLPSWVPDCRVKPSLERVPTWVFSNKPRTNSISFHSDGEGQSGRILQVCGVAVHKSDDGWVIDISSGPKQSTHDAEDENRNETYLIHGALNVYTFRRRDQYLELTHGGSDEFLEIEGHEEISADALLQRYARLNDMVKTNHPKVEILSIC